MGLRQRKSAALWLPLGFILLFAWACESGPREFFELKAVDGFAGVVAADEPHAAVIARDLLSNGANAADAAVAMYLALSVTLPSRVGLLGGGVCIAYSRDEETAEVIEFLPTPSSSGFALPRAIRALAQLHVRHGRVRWGPLVAPAETLARIGHGVSRAFAKDLRAGVGALRANPELVRLYFGGSRQWPEEGDHLVQPELSTVLAGIRSQGAGHFHAGAFPVQLTTAAAEGGQTWPLEELRNALPRLSQATAMPLGDYDLYFSSPLSGDGAVAATLWRVLNEIQPYAEASAEERAELFARAVQFARQEAGRWQGVHWGGADPVAALRELLDRDRLQALFRQGESPNGSSTFGAPSPLRDGASFVVGDRWGNVVACGTSMNGLFGSGQLASGTGMVLPGRPGIDLESLPSVALVADPDDGEAHLALAAAGGSPAVSALVQVLLHLYTEEQSLEDAVSAPRLNYTRPIGAIEFERSTPPATVAGLRAKGYTLREVGNLARVNALHCPRGIDTGDCRVVSDPRAFGSVTRVE